MVIGRYCSISIYHDYCPKAAHDLIATIDLSHHKVAGLGLWTSTVVQPAAGITYLNYIIV